MNSTAALRFWCGFPRELQVKLSNISYRRRALVGAAMSMPLWPDLALAQGSAKPPPPLRDFFRTSSLTNVTYSPDGKYIAGLRDYRGRINITVVDLATRKALIVTSFTDGDVAWVRWVNNQRLLFSMYDRQRGGGDQVGGGLFVIDRDASDYRALSDRSGLTEGKRLMPASTSFHAWVRDNGQRTDEIIVEVPSMQGVGKFSSNLFRLNTSNGRSTLLTLGGPTDVRSWVVDVDHIVRAAVSVREGVTRVHLRDSEQAPWRVIFEFGPEDVSGSVTPLAFDGAGQLYVSAYAGADNAAIYLYDNKTGRVVPDAVAAVKGYDLNGGLRFSADGQRLIGINYEADRDGTYWIDEGIAKWQAQVDKALPDRVNRLQMPQDTAAAPILVSSYSDRDPGRYYLFDPRRGTLESITQSRPWINVDQMRPTQFYRYAARDGLSIPAQLTLPEGSGKFPLIVLHYGGPWVRPIDWSWDPVVQFLVSRGYAVFMPAPRASTGFGAKLFKAGWKQWGLGMQDDVTDGVQDLIKRGVVDAKRVCLAGASYGGYLTMMGLAKEPELFRCGINWVGVTDPSFMFTVTWTDFNRVDSGRYDLPLLIGDPDKDAAQFKRTSPVARAAEIKQPVLMAYGALDDRVPLINGEKMLAALKPHNKNVEWIVYPDEGHGWLKESNNIDFWTRVEKFLATHL
jgi:dipeptidyl aminopeptidase/acylaminoacyl peptidase